MHPVRHIHVPIALAISEDLLSRELRAMINKFVLHERPPPPSFDIHETKIAIKGY